VDLKNQEIQIYKEQVPQSLLIVVQKNFLREKKAIEDPLMSTIK